MNTASAAFWSAARAAVPALPEDPPRADRWWGFGATTEHADELLALVLDGVKTGTAGYLWEYEAEGLLAIPGALPRPERSRARRGVTHNGDVRLDDFLSRVAPAKRRRDAETLLALMREVTGEDP